MKPVTLRGCVILCALVGLFSCQRERQPSDGRSQRPESQSRDDTSTTNIPIAFKAQDTSYVRHSTDGPIFTHIRNVSFSENYLNRDHNLDYYIVKQTQETHQIGGEEGHDSRITMDIYDLQTSKIIRTFTERADDIHLNADFLQSVLYGCCGAENYCQLSEIWHDHTFLTYNDKYYFVDIPNARIQFYLGYLSDAWNESRLVHGELHFAHSYSKLGPGGEFYSNEYRAISKIVFKAKTEKMFKKLIPFSPSITLVRNTDQDQLVEHSDFQELRLWSYNNHKDLRGINFVALRLTFQNDTTISIDIPIKDGLLFGDSSAERTLYIDE